MTKIDIQLRKVNKVYNEGDLLVGDVILKAKAEYQHQGITLAVHGLVMVETYNGSAKAILLLFNSSEISKPGKLSPGKTEIPFQVALTPRSGKYLYETYHGACINIKLLLLLCHGWIVTAIVDLQYMKSEYMITAELTQSLLNKHVKKQCEFLIEYKNQKEKAEVVPVAFTLSSDTWTVANENKPKIKIVGKLDSANMRMCDPLTGEIVIEQCDMAIISVCIRLVRVEAYNDVATGYTEELTDVESIELCVEDVGQHLPIPFYMVFPRLFACPTLATSNFRVGFQVSLEFMFCNGRSLIKVIPINLTR